MNLKQLKIISIIFIVAGLALMVGILFFFRGMPAGQKIVFAVCVAAMIVAMAFNLKFIAAKQKDTKEKNDTKKENK